LVVNRVLRSMGYPSEVAARDGAFLVQIGGLSGENEARALMANLRSVPGVTVPLIQPRN
jgi:hypothetical protein